MGGKLPEPDWSDRPEPEIERPELGDRPGITTDVPPVVLPTLPGQGIEILVPLPIPPSVLHRWTGPRITKHPVP